MKIPHSLRQGSALALLAALTVSGAALAQGSAMIIDPVTEDARTLDHGVPEAVDPHVRSEVIALRSSGLIEMQNRIGTELIVIERLQRRAQAIQGLMSTLGTEGLRQFDPSLHAALQDSPIFMNQRIEELRRQRELEEEQRLLEEGFTAAQDDEEEEEEQRRRGPPDIFNQAPFVPDFGQLRPDPDLQPAPDLSEILPPPSPPSPPPIVDFPISLREILGFNGEFRAVIMHGTELVRVEAGDMLPNDTEILRVESDRIQVRRRDTNFDIHLRG